MWVGEGRRWNAGMQIERGRGVQNQCLEQFWVCAMLIMSPQWHRLIWRNLTDILTTRVYNATRGFLLHDYRSCAFLFCHFLCRFVFLLLLPLIPPSSRMHAKRLYEKRKATGRYMCESDCIGKKERMARTQDMEAGRGVSWYSVPLVWADVRKKYWSLANTIEQIM